MNNPPIDNENAGVQIKTDPARRHRQPLGSLLLNQTPLSNVTVKPLSAPEKTMALGKKRKCDGHESEPVEKRKRDDKALAQLRGLESSGQLTLALFHELAEECQEIDSLNLTPSFGYSVDEWGLKHGSPQPSAGCTQPLYRHPFPSLTKLDLTRVEVGDNDLRYLIKLPSLLALGLSATAITDRGIKYLVQHAVFTPKLQCLKVARVDGITDESLVWMGNFISLQFLDLTGTRVSLGGILTKANREGKRFIGLSLTDLRIDEDLVEKVVALRKVVPSDLPNKAIIPSECKHWLRRLQGFEGVIMHNPSDFPPLPFDPNHRLSQLIKMVEGIVKLDAVCK